MTKKRNAARKRKPPEQHTALIDSLAAKIFPFQESEFEQEAFTDVGRQRVDEWIAEMLDKRYTYDDIARAALDAGITVGIGSGGRLHFYRRIRLAANSAGR